MKSVLGFAPQETQSSRIEENTLNKELTPVKSLVKVSFPSCGLNLSYYNDLFDLSVGDSVFVSGHYAGQLGTVTEVTTKFKICLDDYEKVIARPVLGFRGSYSAVAGKMVSCDEQTISPEEFRTWVIPPVQDDEKGEVVTGDGYSFNLSLLETYDEIDDKIVPRAIEYCERGNVVYLSFRNGVGTAFVRGSKFYEINFRFDGTDVTELYCDCPYAFFCKHALAVLLTIRHLMACADDFNVNCFTAVDRNYFWNIVGSTAQQITL